MYNLHVQYLADAIILTVEYSYCISGSLKWMSTHCVSMDKDGAGCDNAEVQKYVIFNGVKPGKSLFSGNNMSFESIKITSE